MELVAELNELAEEEIEDAALKAAKEAVIEVGSELAYEKTLHEKWQEKAAELDTENSALKRELATCAEKEKKLKEAVAIEGAVILTALIMTVLAIIL